MSFTDKELRAGDDILKPYRDPVQQLDIKLVQPFLRDSTTHVVAGKRNIPKVLVGLVNARYIVTEGFMHAVVKACQMPPDTDSSSPMELDFDGNWPSALEFVPPPSKEPVMRPANLYLPDRSRETIFEDLTFVFVDKHQHDNISEAVSGGGAKCPLHELELGKTDVKEFAKYVRGLAGKKGFDPASKKGPVVLRWRSKDPEYKDWVVKFLESLDLELGQRSAEQNEFLDAILTKDSSGMKRELLEVDEAPVSTDPGPTTRARQSESSNRERRSVAQFQGVSNQSRVEKAQSQAESAEATEVSGRSWRERIARKRFTGFDDSDEDEFAAPTPAPPPTISEEPEEMEVDDESMFIPEGAKAAAAATQDKTRKRAAPNTAEMLDSLLPGSREIKRRRLEADTGTSIAREMPASKPAPADSGSSTQQSKDEKAALARLGKDEIRNAARSHAAAMDQKSQRPPKTTRARKGHSGEDEHDDEEAENNEEDLSKLGELAIVEFVDMPARRAQPKQRADQAREWREEWNGRQNFKQFRRKGTAAANRGQRVIVRLEQDRPEDRAEDEDNYWLQNDDEEQARRAESSDDDNDDILALGSAGKGGRRTASGTAAKGNSIGSGIGVKRPAAAGIASSRAKRTRIRRGGDEEAESSSSSSSSDEEEDGLKLRLRR